MYTQVAQEDMYELCSNVSAGSWPAVLDDELVRIVGDGVRYTSQLPFSNCLSKINQQPLFEADNDVIRCFLSA